MSHNYIGTEHLLLGLLAEEEGLAARVLRSFGLTEAAVQERVAQEIAVVDEVPAGRLPFTRRAKEVLELALREALSVGNNYIGTEHLLLALARESEGLAARILRDFDADAKMVRNEVIRLLSGPGRRGERVSLTCPPFAQETIDEIERVREAKERAIEALDFEEAVKLRDRERELVHAARELQAAWQRGLER